jgi:carboxylesterase type B
VKIFLWKIQSFSADGVLIPESPLMAFKNNHFKKTSILIGTNLNEGSYFLPYWKEEYFPLVDKTFLTREQFIDCIQDFFRYMHYSNPFWPIMICCTVFKPVLVHWQAS